MSTSDNCKDSAPKSNNDEGVCEVSDMLTNMNTSDKEDDNVSVCANCGKEGDSDNMNTCNKCKTVKYCNAACKKKHRKKHKKDCEEHVRLSAELHDIELFKQPPSLYGDCPICFIMLPTLNTGHTYSACCGKLICNGCAHASVYDNQGNKVHGKKCAFCRTPYLTTVEELQEKYKKRVDVDDPVAINNLGLYYARGIYGYPQDYAKALGFYHRAGELGYAEGYRSIGYAYKMGHGVEVDERKAVHYCELAAMGGDVYSRHNLGFEEARAGNIDRALRHYMIAVSSGEADSLTAIQRLYSKGLATKEDYTKALQTYQEHLSQIKSHQRDEAAAAHVNYRYY